MRRHQALFAVPAALHELQIVVAEPPEQFLGALQHAGVVVSFEVARRFVDERRQVSQHGAVDGRRDGPLRFGRGEGEPRGVQQLDCQPPADAHLVGVERRIGSRPAARGPVAHTVGAVLLEQRHRRDDVALGLRHLLAIGSSTHPEIAALVQGNVPCSRCARNTESNNHVRMMSCACGRKSIGKVC
jgi:hypothetical protein